ncbi:hypothetical protein ACH4PW_21000 [Streptomyces sp. NPDC017082]|uniref:hypothetical protein n=1 Tax=Streptomyces sp. NPDC017082 TaxID=3364974 RepID=UPI0037AA26FE
MRKISGSGVRSVVSLLGAGLLVGLATSCSSSSATREYAVPDDVCGIRVAGPLLEPLLPAGKKITAEPTSAVGTQRCRLLVDGKVVFSSSLEKRGVDTTAGDVAASAYGVNPTDAGTNGGDVIYSKTGAVGRVECPNSASANNTVWATARTSHSVKASAMRSFIEGYRAAAAKSACRTLSAH